MKIKRKNVIMCLLLLNFLMSNAFIVLAQDETAPGEQGSPGVEEAAQETPDQEKIQLSTNPGNLSSEEYVRRCWEASSKKGLAKLDTLVKECLFVYQEKAKQLQAELMGFPERGEEKKYQVLNDVATCLFIRAEALMNFGQKDEAISEFTKIIETYPWAQAWDPRGWYWSIKEKSEASINVMLGIEEVEEEIVINRTIPVLHTPGKEQIIDYTKYGYFENVGTKNYKYIIYDVESLAKAVGEGIYPNAASVYNNPRLNLLRKEGRLQGSHWDFVNSDDLEAGYFKWVTAPEPWGVRLFYIGLIFEKSKMFNEALKAYHSLIVHFPQTVAWTYWQTPWYPGQAAIAKIQHLIRMHPELKLQAKWMKIQVENGFDNDPKNDTVITYPGQIFPLDKPVDKPPHKWPFVPNPRLGEVQKKVGEGDVRLVQYENGHWQLLVNDKPYVVKGITYDPTRVGESPDKGTLENWMEQDTNENGLLDGPFEAWVDKNNNNEQDPDEPAVGDFHLMKEMGVNTIRFYHDPTTPDKKLLRKLYKKYGIRVIIGDFLGKYTVGSGADWFSGTDYNNAEHKMNMLESVKKMVMEHKDEPYVLMWLLGNENNYGVGCNADKEPEAYFKFANDVAEWIKTVDPNHPVALCNGDMLYLDIFAEHAPAIDIFSANVYRGDYGFGSFWDQVFEATGKPAFITEYGCPAFAPFLTLEQAEEAQAAYHIGNWKDIEANMAGTNGTGNALGGVAFEWLDEWWKNYEPYRHDKKSDAIGPFPGGVLL